MPGVRLALTYDRRWARHDIVAGIVLAAILLPQGMAYAELAGLPPVTGLYTTIARLVGYSVFGPSRIVVLGPDSSVSPMIFAAIAPLLAGGNEHRATGFETLDRDRFYPTVDRALAAITGGREEQTGRQAES